MQDARADGSQVFTVLDKEFSKFFTSWRAHFLEKAAQNLVALVPHVQIYCISTNPDRPVLPDDYDEALIFDSIITEIFDFVARAARHHSVQNLLVQVGEDGRHTGTELVHQLLLATTSLMQVPSLMVGQTKSVRQSGLG